VLPVCYEVPEASLTDIPLTSGDFGTYNQKTGEWEGGSEYQQYVRAQHKAAKERSDSLGDGLKTGKLFQVNVADGYAYYVVTRVNKKSVRVECRYFGGDSYCDQVLGAGDSFPKSAIEPLIRRQEGLKKLFATK